MTTQRRIGARGPLTLVSALLLSSALAAPAFAQIEEVIVTAQKKSEDIQTVPIAVSAFSAADLAAHQIVQFKDLQFSTPSVSYTKTNFTSSNFQIRGIGTQVISGDAESGVAFNVDDVYYAAAPVDSGQFYDLERVEILRGPQSTLYGRGATGGAVNVFSHKPDLDVFSANFDASYGNYNAWETKGMVNVPIIDGELGVRIAADRVKRDGFATNVFVGTDDKHPDSRDVWSIRGLVRWQPTANTTVDFIVAHAKEDDTRMRGQKQLCHSDPSGVLGCLPDSVAMEPVNLNATYFNIPVSKQALGTAFTPVYGSYAAASGLGLFDLSTAFVAPPGAVPSDPHTINSDFTPTLKGESNSYTGKWTQKIGDWLDATLVGNAAWGNTKSQESYTNFPTANWNPVLLGTSLATFQGTLNNFVAFHLVPAIYADPVNGPYAYVLNPAHAGTLPASNFDHLGIIGGSIYKYAPNELAYDQSSGQTSQRTIDFRLNTDLSGPLNFMAAVFYLNTETAGDYFVANNTLDYGQTLFGAILGPVTPDAYVHGLCANATGCIYGTPYYDNRAERVTLDSRAAYAEAYYDMIPDTLKLTLGLRYTEDVKKSIGRITIFNGFIPTGSTDVYSALAAVVASEQYDFDGGNNTGIGGAPADPSEYDTFYHVRSAFDKTTGRAVLTWTPKTDFTDATTVYASYARGYKAGGSNPGVQTGNLSGLSPIYGPESIDAFEVGTKNMLMDGTLQANLTGWYYDYKGYQVSQIIANTSINSNIDAKLYGVEGEFQWVPTTNWAFNFNANYTHSAVGDVALVDPRNPGGNDPTALTLKDSQLSPTNAQNCVLYHTGSAANFDADFATLSAITGGHIFFAPPGGIHQLSGAGVGPVAYGSCYGGIDPSNPFYGLSLKSPAMAGALAFSHWSLENPATGGTLVGVPTNLTDNKLGNTPDFSFSVGAQYTAMMANGYSLVPRVDYYWQSDMWGRIFSDPADKIRSWGVANAQITLNAPDNAWYAQAFIKNAFDSDNTTGQYLTSSSSGLWTGTFYGDPRTYGIAVGARF